MNAKEAREIINLQSSNKGNLGSYPIACVAKGYLEALEGPEIEALMRSFKEIWIYHDEMPSEQIETLLGEAFTQYREAIKDSK